MTKNLKETNKKKFLDGKIAGKPVRKVSISDFLHPVLQLNFKISERDGRTVVSDKYGNIVGCYSIINNQIYQVDIGNKEFSDQDQEPLRITMELIDGFVVTEDGSEYEDLDDALEAAGINFEDFEGTVENYMNNGKLIVVQQGDGFRARIGRHSVYGESIGEAISNLEYHILD